LKRNKETAILGCDSIKPINEKLISICIPTYNHAEPLRKTLEAMIPQAQKFKIPIYISDNASNDGTAELVKRFQKVYKYLYYSSNEKNLGVDQNMINAANMGASSQYVWTIGARRILLPGMLEKVYQLLSESKVDLLVLNDLNNTFLVPESQRYNSAQKIFIELNRNLTGLGFQVLPSEAWRSDTLCKYVGTEWTIVGVTLEYIAQKENLNAYFLSEPVATSSGPSHWRPKFFQIWTNWKKTIYSLPSVYPDKDKKIVIRKSVRYLFVSSVFTLIQLRTENIFTAQTFKKYRQDITEYAGISPTVAYVISRFPIFPLKIYFKVYETLRGILRKFIHHKKPLNPTRKTAVSYL
jgi:glycosyltransferase involved in cell wall biosynthesis